MKVQQTSRGQLFLTLPTKAAKLLGIEKGDIIHFKADMKAGKIFIEKVKPSSTP